MREIDVDTWHRREVFHYFRDFDDPYFSMTANVDVTSAFSVCKAEGLSVSLALLHRAISACNRISAFRTRIVGDKVVEFDMVHASQTVLRDDESFSFCYHEAGCELRDFVTRGEEAVARSKSSEVLDENPGRVDQVFFSVIPWVSFTSFKNAQRRDHTQTVPRIVFGRIFEASGKRLMPASVEVHHAVIDGIHVGTFFDTFQKLLDETA